jgi:hypothetical protein
MIRAASQAVRLLKAGNPCKYDLDNAVAAGLAEAER